MNRPRLVLASLIGVLTLLTVASAQAGDWPQWLGPTRQAISDETIAPWKEAPQAAWSVPVGEGHSSPVVADGRVFLHAKVTGEDAEVLTAFDAESGDKLWEKSYPRGPFMTPFGNGPRSTPTVAGDRVYTFGSTGILSCFNVANGDLKWQVDTLKEYEAENLVFGVSSSPLVHEGLVLVMVGGKGASVVAFDAMSGAEKWKSGDDPASYASPLLRESGNDTHAIFLTGAHLLALKPDTGEQVWAVPFKDLLNESSTTPVKVGDLVVASSVTAGSIGVKAGPGDEAPEQVWKKEALTCYFSTPVALTGDDPHLYMVTGRIFPSPAAVLRCVKAETGEQVWEKAGVGRYHASLTRLADGKVLLLEENGSLVLLDGSAKEYGELARAKVCGETWAHAALANGQLYLRDNKSLLCFSLGGD